MDAHQFRQLVTAARGGKKVPEFSTGDPVDWTTWRSNFVLAAEINGWDNGRQRREIASAMVGVAKTYVRSIPLGIVAGVAAAAVPDPTLLLDAYENRFIPEAGGDVARIAFKAAKQAEDETVLNWHSRLRDLYQRGYPQMLPDAVEVNQDLRDNFITGLANAVVADDTWKARPATYDAALTAACNFVAAARVREGRGMGPGDALKKEPGPGLYKLQPASAEVGDECFACKQRGHFKRDCEIWKTALAKARRTVRGEGQVYGDRGDRGERGGGRGRGGRWTTKRGAGWRGSNRGRYARGGGRGERPRGEDLRARVNSMKEETATKTEAAASEYGDYEEGEEPEQGNC
jgi:hypothetical protein